MIFIQFSCDFSQFSCDFSDSSVVIFYTVQLWFLVGGKRLGPTYGNVRVTRVAAVIRQAVRDELRRQSQTESDTGNQNVESTASTSSNQRTERTERRLSGLLDRIRKQPKGKKRKIRDKENRIQMRWIHFNDRSKVFVPVRQRNGGGNRFISYNALEPPTVDEIKQKARALFFS